MDKKFINDDSFLTLNEIKSLNYNSLEVQNLNSQLLVLIKDLLIKNSRLLREKQFHNPLNNYGRKCFSQTDEDGITLEIIRRLGIDKGNFAEFGVGNGLENNTLILSASKWKGFWVGSQDLCFDHMNKKNFYYNKKWVDLDNIIQITKESMNYLSIDNLDLLSLDLDGNDYFFLTKLLNNNIFPKVFIVEYNAKFFPPIEFVIDYDKNHKWTGDDYFGASLTSLEKLFKKFDYKLVCCNGQTGANAFFVKNKYKNLFKDVPDKIEKIFIEPNYELTTKYGHYPSPKVIKNIFKEVN
tara:strand:- start:882 stop:1769 length:888 start_codon:yes stop_codon:yes gene_type:complete